MRTNDDIHEKAYILTLRTSPKSWNRAFSPRKTPAVVGPEFKPTRSERLAVPCSTTQRKDVQLSVRIL